MRVRVEVTAFDMDIDMEAGNTLMDGWMAGNTVMDGWILNE